MVLDLNKIRSLVEYNLTSKNFGNPPGNLPPGFTLTKAQVWTTNTSDIPFTTREFRDAIAQCLYDILTDATSDGTSLSQPLPVGGDPNTYYSGGNKTAGTGKLKLETSTGYVEIDGTAKTAKLVQGTCTVELNSDTNISKLTQGNIVIELDGTHAYAKNGVKTIDILQITNGADFLVNQVFS